MVYSESEKDLVQHTFSPPEIILDGISHDIRRTLNGISIMFDEFEASYKLKKNISSDSLKQVLRIREVIDKLSSKLSRIVDDADEHKFRNFDEFFSKVNAKIANTLKVEHVNLLQLAQSTLEDRSVATYINVNFSILERVELRKIATSIDRARRALLALSTFADVNREIKYDQINIYSEVNRLFVDLVAPLTYNNRKIENISIEGQVTAETSQFAIASILGNLITNAMVHGRRRAIDINVKISSRYLPELQNKYKHPFKRVVEPLEWVEIQVCDNGVGIPLKDRHTIFDLFEQSKSKRGNRSGSGVGLSLVVYALELLGGGIELRSTENMGTCFLVILPDGVKARRSPQVLLGTRELKGTI